MTMRIDIKAYAVADSIYFPLYDKNNSDTLISGASFEAGDVEISYNGASFNNTTNLPVEIDSSGVYALALTSAELSSKKVLIKIADQTAPKVWMDDVLEFDVTPWRTISDKMQIWEVNDGVDAPTATSARCDWKFGAAYTADDTLVDRYIQWLDGPNAGAVQLIETYTVNGEDDATFTFTEVQTESASADGNKFIVF